jgi:hypothetical protein
MIAKGIMEALTKGDNENDNKEDNENESTGGRGKRK